MQWKKGRGRLAVFEALIGSWISESDSPRGPIKVVRTFSKTLGGKYIELQASWQFNESHYDELALFGVDDNKKLSFWSFTSDGKRSTGVIVEAKDIHPAALAFQANMPAGVARQAYWPDPDEGFHWAVESQTKKGWNRFVEHHYLPVRSKAIGSKGSE